MKIYAIQVPPEYQESPLFFPGCFPENIAVYGNRDLNEHAPEVFTRAREALHSGELLEAWKDINDGGRGYYYNWASALVMLVPPENRGPYTREERKNRWPDIARRYYEARTNDDENRALCDALELMTGEPWDITTIHGCCQGDWQNVCYPVNAWSREAIAEVETMYFNTGTEWIIHESDTEPDGSDDIDGFSCYVTEWRDDDIRKTLANVAGHPDAEVVLYQFSGWSRSAKYTEV